MSVSLDLIELVMFRRLSRKKRRTLYIREIFKNRIKQGELKLLYELESDEVYHQKYIRMRTTNFDYILAKILPRISHTTTHRYPISPRLRLALTIRYLATGASHMSLSFSFRISPSSVGIIVREVLQGIWLELKDEFLPAPSETSWKSIAKDFQDKWNFPNCLGALDGKLVQIQNFANQGSEYYNYKKYFSTNLLACVDANYRFVVVIIGAHGSESDSGILERSDFGSALFGDSLNTPKTLPVPELSPELPCVFIGDQGFPLKPNLMRPFPLDINLTLNKKVFNYRLSRARRVVENAFGILAVRFRIFHVPINAKEDLVKLIIQGAIILHNFLISVQDNSECITADFEDYNGNIIPGSWRSETNNDSGMVDMRYGSNNSSSQAKHIRNVFMEYFVTPGGSVSWQWDKCSNGLYM